jgi:hypothetical protein
MPPKSVPDARKPVSADDAAPVRSYVKDATTTLHPDLERLGQNPPLRRYIRDLW